jgi:hypothetical protein
MSTTTFNPGLTGLNEREQEAFNLGYVDGEELSSGRTWDESAGDDFMDLNEAYDFGATVGVARARYERATRTQRTMVIEIPNVEARYVRAIGSSVDVVYEFPEGSDCHFEGRVIEVR